MIDGRADSAGRAWVGGGGFGRPLPQGGADYVMAMSDAKVGVMGCGVVAGYGHLPALRDTAGVQPWALYDPNLAAVEAMARRYDIPAERAFTDESAFFDSGLDGVLVSSPAPAHEANVLAAVGRGLPVLCEKPLAMDRAQGLRMIAAAEAATPADHVAARVVEDGGQEQAAGSGSDRGMGGVPLYVAFCYRFSPASLRIKQLVAEGAIGELRSMRLIYNWDCHGKYLDRDPAKGLAPHRDGRMREGGPMVDCGTHQIDLAQWWADSPVVEVSGHGAWADSYQAPDHCWAQLTHGNGCHTSVEMSYSYGHTVAEPLSVFTYELIGSEGLILYDRNYSRFELRDARGTHRQTYHEEKGFHEMYAALAEALRTGRPGHLPTAREGLAVTEVAVEANQQAIRGRRQATAG